MNINRTFSIEENLANRLKEENNQSKIINELLKDYYASGGSLEEDELKAEKNKIEGEIIKLTKSIEMINKRLERVVQKKRIIEEKFKNIPKEILEDFRRFPNMDEHTLMDRYREIYGTRYSCTFAELKEALTEFKKK